MVTRRHISGPLALIIWYEVGCQHDRRTCFEQCFDACICFKHNTRARGVLAADTWTWTWTSFKHNIRARGVLAADTWTWTCFNQPSPYRNGVAQPRDVDVGDEDIHAALGKVADEPDLIAPHLVKVAGGRVRRASRDIHVMSGGLIR